MLYVLTQDTGSGRTLNEKRPVAVVDDENIANQWANASATNDWIGFEINDLSLTGMPEHASRPSQAMPEDKLNQTLQTVQQTNNQLISIIEQLATRYKDKEILKVVDKFKPGMAPSPSAPGALKLDKSSSKFASDLLRKLNDQPDL
jgi:hypothetical protein